MTAMFFKRVASSGSRLRSFFSKTSPSSAPCRATWLPARLYREMDASTLVSSSQPKRSASPSKRRTLSSSSAREMRPSRSAGSSVSRFMNLPVGISRSSPAAAALTPSCVASQSDMYTPPKPQSPFKTSVTSRRLSVMCSPLVRLYPLITAPTRASFTPASKAGR